MQPGPRLGTLAASVGGRGGASHRAWGRLALFCLAVVAFVLVPYLLLGRSFEDSAAGLFTSQTSRIALAGFGVLLLAADMVLPVPSSLVATGLGAALGWFWGMLAGAAGLTLGCMFGFAAGRLAGYRFMAERVDADHGYVVKLLPRYGSIVLVLFRGVPVLAEASVIAAGALGMPPSRCIAVTTLANLGVASVYAGIGAAAWDVSAGFAFAALLLPGLLLGGAHVVRGMFKPAARNVAQQADIRRNSFGMDG